MKFWKYSRVALALIGSVALGLSITCCGVYTSGYMYVTGAQFNQIGGYKIDHDFGYLTPVTGSPFANAGGTPLQEAVIPGGRFLAVVSQGTPGIAGSGSVSIYSIGGGGVIAFQHTYFTSGINPVAAALAPAGNYLYVLDQIAPPDVINGVDQNASRGDVTVFAINSSSGKLTLITNQNTFNTNGTQLPYFPVNYKPIACPSWSFPRGAEHANRHAGVPPRQASADAGTHAVNSPTNPAPRPMSVPRFLSPSVQEALGSA